MKEMHWRWLCEKTLWLCCTCISVFTHGVFGSDVSSDTCISKISGSGSEKGVHAIHTSCVEGSVDWIDTEGGLQILFDIKPHKRLCLLISATDSSVHIYKASKKLISVAGSVKPVQKELCISGEDTEELLLFESWQPGLDANIRMDFLVEDPLPITDDEICRPCTPQEVVDAYCSHEFVVSGSMTRVQDDVSLRQTKIDVRAKSLYRQKANVFQNTADGQFVGTVLRPLQCATRYGAGQYLFMGKVRFGKGHISCAPTWQEWERIRTSTEAKDSVCDLER